MGRSAVEAVADKVPWVESAISSSDWIWVLGSLCQIQHVHFDPGLVEKRFPPPHTLASLRCALLELGFELSDRQPSATDFAHLRLPAVGFVNSYIPAGSAGQIPSYAPVPALLVRTDGERLLYFRAGSQTAETLLVKDFPDVFEGGLITAHAKPRVASADGLASDPQPFGFKWFLPELVKHRRVFRDVLLASLFLQLVGLVTPLFTQVVIDKVVVHHTRSTLVVIALGLAIALVFGSILGWLRQYLLIHTGNRIDAVLSLQVFRHLLRLPMGYFAQRPTGTLVARIHGVETIREFLAGATVSLLLDLPFMAIFLAVMFWYAWQLTLIALAGLAVIAAASAIITPLLRRRLNRQFLLGARSQSFLTEYVAGMETVKSLQLEPQLENRFGEITADYLVATFRTKSLANTYNIVANALEQAQGLAILAVGALLVMDSDGFTIGMLVAFQMFSGRLSQPVLRLVGLYQEFQQTRIAVERLGDVVNIPQEPHTLVPHRAKGQGHGAAIEAEGLGFRYGPDQPWLYRRLDLFIPAGKTIALVGPSGCGKSTLAKLLLGFHWAEEGRIRVDGTDIRHLAANELRALFGVVPQETILFSGTLHDNLVAANPYASFEDVVEACTLAQIHADIEALPKGYQTEIGERGIGLSGGQKQRLAIARALLKKPRILVFDEATANLNDEAAEGLAQVLNQLKGQVTVLFIAHRLPKGLAIDANLILGGDST